MKKFVTPETIIETDGWRGYFGLEKEGYKQEELWVDENDELLPQVQLVISLLKK